MPNLLFLHPNVFKKIWEEVRMCLQFLHFKAFKGESVFIAPCIPSLQRILRGQACVYSQLLYSNPFNKQSWRE
jgi:hypothetical protein